MLVSGVEHNDSISVYNKSITTTHNWTSLMAQLLKNPPAMRKIWVQYLGWEDLLEKGTPVFWPGEFHGQRSLAGYTVDGVAKRQTGLSNFHFHHTTPHRVTNVFLLIRTLKIYFLSNFLLLSCCTLHSHDIYFIIRRMQAIFIINCFGYLKTFK